MKTLITTIILFLGAVGASGDEHNISIAAIFQNEARFLEEWILHHEKLGVTHFRLYNNNSTDNYKDVLRPFQQRRLVTLIEWPHQPKDNDWSNFSFTVQTGAYNDALRALRGKTKWLALIDTDEFIIEVGKHTLKGVLKHLPPKSALYLNWRMYNCNGVWDCRGSLLKNITRHAPKNHGEHRYCKSIVQPKYVVNCPNPHFCVLAKGYLRNTDHEVQNQFNVTKVCWDKLLLNHYWSRDLKFFEQVKVPRYKQWGGDESAIRNRESSMAGL